jgi:hypothetical protein
LMRNRARYGALSMGHPQALPPWLTASMIRDGTTR